MTRISVVGPGAVGGYFAGHLTNAGRDVVACARRPFERYVIESKKHPLDIPAVVLTDPAQISGPVAWVLLGVKAHQTEGAAQWLGALCDPETRVVVMQNGIEPERAAPFVGGAQIVPSVVYCGAELLEPGHIEHRSAGFLIVPPKPFGHELAELFHGCAAGIRPQDDFPIEQWRKLAINVVANGLTALTNRGLGVLGEPHLYTVAVEMMRECCDVARADGVEIGDDWAEGVVDRMAAMADEREESGTSMLFDVRAGRPTEHDAIHGALLRKADKHGIATPTVRTIHALLDAR